MTSCPNCGHSSEAVFKFCPECGTKVEGQGGNSLAGRTVAGKYRVLEEIGAGAMGRVYAAEHLTLKRKVALKVLHEDLQVSDESLQRFQREGIAAGRFNHPNSIQIFDFDRDGERTFFLAMEFVEGEDLKKLLRRVGRLPAPQAVDVIAQVLSVLAEGHRLGIVHRDLKPDNIMVSPLPEGGHAVKVLDFGLSKLIDVPTGTSLQTQVGRILGTPLYMAPEQVAGEDVDHRSDLYAAGLVLYELLAGLTPFADDSTTEILFTRASREAPSIRDSFPELGVPPELDEVVARALERRRENRWQSAEEMLAALEAARPEGAPQASGQSRSAGVSARPAASRRGTVTPASGPGAQRSPRKVGVTLAVVLVLGALATGGALFFGGADAGAEARVRLKPSEARSLGEVQYLSLLDDARRAIGRGDPEGAIGRVREALTRPEADAEAYLVRADAFRAQGDSEAALRDLADALERDPGYDEARAAQGWIHLAQGDLDGAEAAFAGGDDADELPPGRLAGLGAVLHARGETERALPMLERAVTSEGAPAAAYRVLGELRLANDDVEGALDALIEARRADPGDWRNEAALAEAYLASGDRSSASDHLARALEAQPRESALRGRYAALLVEEERFGLARSVLEKGIELDSRAARLHALLGVVLAEEGDAPGAIQHLRRAADEGEDDPRLHTLLGVLLQGEGRGEEAVEAFDEALLLDEKTAVALLDKGLVRFQEGLYDEAGELLERAVEADPDLAYAHYALGVLCMDYLGDEERALEHLRRYREIGGRERRVDAWIERLAR